MGLGYVGLPLAVAFGSRMKTVGYDPHRGKVDCYRRGVDPAGEISDELFRAAEHLNCTSDPAALAECEVVIVAVPTPVDEARLPDFGPLLSACRDLGPHLRSGATVVFESTVYPGATESVCVPALERASGKVWKRDFSVGYSPERINPGDREHTVTKVIKVVAGDTAETLDCLASLYGRVIEAGIHRAASIQVAEAAKVIENTQRDLNIALMNELAIIFHRLGIDSRDVLDAAGTKWNFLRFKPGLVGGHCIGVDPYYLTYQAERHGHHPQVILAGRRINDGMGRYIGREAVKEMVAAGTVLGSATVNVLGLTFKENCADLRNSKVVDVIAELRDFGVRVNVHDPRVTNEAAKEHYGIDTVSWEEMPTADALLLAVAHDEFARMPLERLLLKVRRGGCVIDVKSVLDRNAIRDAGVRLWRL
jgi:UDP-N-acetyl-D-galactosamine dehydrogenase